MVGCGTLEIDDAQRRRALTRPSSSPILWKNKMSSPDSKAPVLLAALEGTLKALLQRRRVTTRKWTMGRRTSMWALVRHLIRTAMMTQSQRCKEHLPVLTSATHNTATSPRIFWISACTLSFLPLVASACIDNSRRLVQCLSHSPFIPTMAWEADSEVRHIWSMETGPSCQWRHTVLDLAGAFLQLTLN